MTAYSSIPDRASFSTGAALCKPRPPLTLAAKPEHVYPDPYTAVKAPLPSP